MITFEQCKSFKGRLTVPADKSITHRAIMMASMADAVSVINNPLLSRDTLATASAFVKMGVSVVNERTRLLIHSEGYKKFQEPTDVIDCENSGTTARILTGVLAPSKFYSVVTGDASLRRRPMGRVVKPLNSLGANISARKDNTLLPLTIMPSNMLGGEVVAEKPSAQVKSSIIMAALQIDGETVYTEKTPTRDHTERMLKFFGADISSDNGRIVVRGGKPLHGVNCVIPGDFSSAAFFIAAGLAFEGSEIVIEGCGLNPSRTGLLTALKSLGVNVEHEVTNSDFEPYGTIRINHTPVKGGVITGEITANLIDEVPVLGFLALFAESPIEIRNAAELRVKESDRIAALAENFKALGAKVEEFPDGLKVYPLDKEPNKCVLKSFDDHRICMINILLAKKFGLKVMIDDISPLDVSFPDFIDAVIDMEQK